MLCQFLLYIIVIQSYYIHSFSHTIFPYGLSQEPGYSSLCYTEGPHCLSNLNVIVHASTNPKLPIHPTHFPFPLATTSLFSMLVSQFLFYRYVHLCHFISNIQVISYGICLSLSDLLHLIWYSLVASTLLQMALFHSFWWLSSISFTL